MNTSGENIRAEPRIAADCRSVGALSANNHGVTTRTTSDTFESGEPIPAGRAVPHDCLVAAAVVRPTPEVAPNRRDSLCRWNCGCGR